MRAFALLALFAPSVLIAQNALTIDQVVATVLERYPALHTSEAGVQAAAAGIQLARTAYLPELTS